jgi:AcrR family transcriptional regulator
MAKRSETSRKSILDATLHLLLDEGMSVQKLSIEAIAREAGVGKTTIYRWWPSKAAVVIDAFMENHLLHTPMRDDLPVVQALEEHLASLIAEYAGPPGRLIAQIIAESQYDPATQKLFLERFFEDRYWAVINLLRKGLETGELPAAIDPELVSEMLYAPVYQHLLFGHRPLDPKLAKALVSQALVLFNVDAKAPAPARSRSKRKAA